MKAVVCGGSGFLGSHVADALSERGIEVTLFDVKPSRYVNVRQHMVIGDILDREAVSAALKGAEVVYHLAGMGDLDDVTTKPLDTITQNVMGTAILLEASVRAGITRFVYASPVYVYSQLGGFYPCIKQAAELYIEEYQRRSGLAYTILRYGTLYGPRADRRNSVWRYLHQSLAERKIVFPGTGEEVREYIHVRDAARLSVEILNDEFANQHLIITGHHPMRTKDMLGMVREVLHQDVAIEFVPGAAQTHYTLTPYAFTPKIGDKLVSNRYVDMGQGLLECLQDIHSESPLGKPRERLVAMEP